MKIYIVGGAVRDYLLGHPVNDYDFVVTGTTPQEMLDQGFKQVGADFPVFLHPETKAEYALARKERKTGTGYLGFETYFDPGVTIEEDLHRRDLSINAMAVAEEDWDAFRKTLDKKFLIDPYGGCEDLMHSRLHIVSDAFAEDPVRILRVARFRARFGFIESTATTAAILKMVGAGEVDTLVPERIWSETVKAICEKYPLDFFLFLDRHDCLETLFPHLEFTAHLAADFRHVEVMSADQRMAMLTSGFESTEQISEFFNALKAPSNFRSLAVATHHFAELGRHELDPATFIDTLATTGAWQDASDASQGLHIAVAMDEKFTPTDFHSRIEFMQSILSCVCHVGFKDLTTKQRRCLKGKDIGDALRDLRIGMVERKMNG